MLVSYKWLKTFFHKSVLQDKTAFDIADILTSQGIEVASIDYLGDTFSGVVVGEVKTCEKHPEAYKLSICTVTDGSEDFQVICGASNVQSGIKVAFAKIGAILPNDFYIKKAKLRGAESFGMICSEKELGLALEADGIWVLPNDVQLGYDMRTFVEFDDYVLDIEITPNRGDCLSMLGIAREVAAGLNCKLKKLGTFCSIDAAETKKLDVEIKNKDLCSSYMAAIVDNIEPQQTPVWMKSRLIKSGIRPINFIVDITNYVLLETGHPMHVFDYDKLNGQKIVVRNAKKGEELLALDGEKYKLNDHNFVIADVKNPIAIAGVMGGEESGVADSTKIIVFESAVFESKTVRKTSKELMLSTDSSYRFERGASREVSELAINRAIYLIKQFLPEARVVQKVDVLAKDIEEIKVELRVAEVSRMLGKEYDKTSIHEILERLGFETIKKTEDILEIIVPDYRNDIRLEVDLIEEIARIDGFDNIDSEPMKIIPFYDKDQNDKWEEIHKAKNFLKRLSFHEAINYSFLSSEKIKFLAENIDDCFRIVNPLSEGEEYLNVSRLPRLIENAALSFKRSEEVIKLFELGKRYRKSTNDAEKLEDNEKYKLAGVVIGNQNECYWKETTNKMDFYYLKGVLESFCKDFIFELADYSFLEKGQSSRVMLGNGQELGFIGKLNKKIGNAFDIKADIFVFEIDFLFGKEDKFVYKKLSAFPKVTRDLALIGKKAVKYCDIENIIRNVSGDILKDIKIFDVYEGNAIDENLRNISVRLYFQSDKKTLEDKTVNFLQDKIVKELKENLDVGLRK